MAWMDTILFKKDNLLFKIRGGNLTKSSGGSYGYEDVFNQVLSTFKFTQ